MISVAIYGSTDLGTNHTEITVNESNLRLFTVFTVFTHAYKLVNMTVKGGEKTR